VPESGRSGSFWLNHTLLLQPFLLDRINLILNHGFHHLSLFLSSLLVILLSCSLPTCLHLCLYLSIIPRLHSSCVIRVSTEIGYAVLHYMKTVERQVAGCVNFVYNETGAGDVLDNDCALEMIRFLVQEAGNRIIIVLPHSFHIGIDLSLFLLKHLLFILHRAPLHFSLYLLILKLQPLSLFNNRQLSEGLS
jgi:hypothetical protein